MGSILRTWLFIAMLGAVIGLGAQPAAAETSLDVTTPAGGRFQPGRSTPLIVTIEADRAISGTLNATFDGFRAGSQRVEVPGGSAKDIVFIVTVPPWSGSGSVSFDGDNEEDDATARINLISAGGDEVVAVLPELAARDLPESAGVAADVGVARLFPIEVDLLDAGSGVLGPFSQVLVTSGDLEALDETRLAALEAWVGTEGGVLVVDEEPGTPLPIDVEANGSALAPGTFGYGLGEIVFSGGEAAKGAYDGLLRPTATTSPDEFPWGFRVRRRLPDHQHPGLRRRRSNTRHRVDRARSDRLHGRDRPCALVRSPSFQARTAPVVWCFPPSP